MLLKLRNFPEGKIAIIVVRTTGRASRIAQLLAKLAINLEARTTLRVYANQRSLDSGEDQTEIVESGMTLLHIMQEQKLQQLPTQEKL